MKSFFPEIFPKVQVRHALTNGPAEKQLQRKQQLRKNEKEALLLISQTER